MKDISLVLAFSAGLLSFLSPCVLPLIPAYISYLTGSSIDDIKSNKQRLYTLYKAIGFTLGFSIIFIVMGLSVTALGRYFDRYQDYIRIIGGILVIIFGLHITGLVKIKYLYFQKRVTEPGKLKSGASSILLGNSPGNRKLLKILKKDIKIYEYNFNNKRYTGNCFRYFYTYKQNAAA
ncbi:MAG: ccdA [Clostridia bacterium]|nr:ccdA [Clostridia bacterium]